MTPSTARLARSITWASSNQSYLTARLLADRDLADDCLRAYAYFRWADDMIDISLSVETERTAFIVRQKTLIDRLYRRERPAGLSPEEARARAGFSSDLADPMPAVVAHLSGQGLLEEHEGRVRLTQAGLPLADYVARQFLAASG